MDRSRIKKKGRRRSCRVISEIRKFIAQSKIRVQLITLREEEEDKVIKMELSKQINSIN